MESEETEIAEPSWGRFIILEKFFLFCSGKKLNMQMLHFALTEVSSGVPWLVRKTAFRYCSIFTA